MEINWNILNLECKTSENGLSKVVSRIFFKCTATITFEGKDYLSEIQGPADLPSPNPNDFTPYESLTKEQVMSWLLESLGERCIQETIDQLQYRLNEQINPTTVILNPPFEN
jgi:hypothetical protein